jgi:Bacterial regulatory protein, Fis family
MLSDLLMSIGEVCRAEAVALWIPVDGYLNLVADWHLDQRLYDLLSRHDLSNTELQFGRRVQVAAGVAALPLLDHDGSLLGVLQYVGALPERDARRIFLDHAMTRFAAILGDAPPPSRESAQLLTLVAYDFVSEVDGLERRTYMEFLERCGWDVSMVASVLEYSRQSLYDRLEALNLVRPTAEAKRRRPGR